MSKFKVGDWWDIQDASYEMIADLVDELEQDGWEVEWYIRDNGLMECCKWPRIGLRPECGTITLFTSNNYDFEESRKLPLSVIGQTECSHTLIDELEAQVENLEELVSDQAHQINQLTEALDNFTRLTHYFSTEGAGKLPNAKLGDSVVDAILDYFKNEYSRQYNQAQCYFRLHDLLQKHESFQKSGKCRSDELADTIEVLQDAYDRLPNRFR